jgi:hypothetical protein
MPGIKGKYRHRVQRFPNRFGKKEPVQRHIAPAKRYAGYFSLTPGTCLPGVFPSQYSLTVGVIQLAPIQATIRPEQTSTVMPASTPATFKGSSQFGFIFNGIQSTSILLEQLLKIPEIRRNRESRAQTITMPLPECGKP